MDVDLCKQHICRDVSSSPFVNYIKSCLLVLTIVVLTVQASFGSPLPWNFVYAFYAPLLAFLFIVKLYRCSSLFIYRRMWKALVIMSLLSSMVCAQENFWAGVDKQTIDVKDKVILTVIVEGKNEALPSFQLSNLKMVSKPKTIVSSEFMNGHHQVFLKYIYHLQPQKIGLAKISKIQYRIDKQHTYTQPEIELNVVATKSNHFPQFSIQLKPQIFELYSQQICPIDIILQHPYDTKVEKVDFAFRKSPNYQVISKQFVSKNLKRQGVFLYRELKYRKLIIPKIMDKRKVTVGLQKCDVHTFTTESENNFDKAFGRDKDFEDDFFRKNPLNKEFGAKPIIFPLSVQDAIIYLRKLPPSPRGFIGAIGEFSAITSWRDQDTQPKLHITLSGNGNLEFATNLFFKENNDCRVKSIKTNDVNYKSFQEMSKTFVIEFDFFRKGIIDTSPYFCYFSPEKNEYRYIGMETAYDVSEVTGKKIPKWLIISVVFMIFAIATITILKSVYKNHDK